MTLRDPMGRAVEELRLLLGDGVPPDASEMQVVKAAAGTIRFYQRAIAALDAAIPGERADGEPPAPLPLAVGRVSSYCGRVERPHAGHVWSTQPGRWCPGDELADPGAAIVAEHQARYGRGPSALSEERGRRHPDVSVPDNGARDVSRSRVAPPGFTCPAGSLCWALDR